LIVIFLRLVSQRLGEYFYVSKLFFKIQKRLTMITIAKNSVKAGKYVNRQQVNTFIRAYKQETWIHNSDRIGKEDALSCWYSVEDLEMMLEKIKTHGGDGVRMHFGIYPEGYNNNSEYAGRQAIVMVGTRSTDGSVKTSKELFVGRENSVLAFIGDYPCPNWCPLPSTPPIPHQKAEVGVTLVDRGEKGFSVI
jgi:hypothetical protein